MNKNRILKMRNDIKEIAQTLEVTPDHNDFGHFYKFGEPRYPSVSWAIQILKDPSLHNWRMNHALAYIHSNFGSITESTLYTHIESARSAPESEMNNAGTIGRLVHDWREQIFNASIEQNLLDISPLPYNSDNPSVISGCRGVMKFVKEHNYIPLACELPVASHELKVGGTIDDIGFVDGELSLVDLKTSNAGDKESYYAQVALYLYMFRKLYRLRPKKLYILHVSKDFGDYNLIEIPDIEWTIKWAKKVVEVSWGIETIKQSKKKKYIKI